MARIALALEFVLAALAILVALRRDHTHAWAAALFVWVAICDVGQFLINALLNGVQKPFTGGALIIFHTGHLLLISREVAFAAACVWYWGRRSPLPLLLFMAAAWVPTLDYPIMSGQRLKMYYLGVVAVSQLVAWTFGLVRIFGRRSPRAETAHHALLVWGCTTLYLLLDAKFIEQWAVAAATTVLGTTAVIGVHLYRLTQPVAA